MSARRARARGEAEMARRLLLRAVELSPRRISLWMDLANLAEATADSPLLRRALDGALAAEPGHPPALARRAGLLRRSGDLEGAERDLRRALADGAPPEPAVFLELADLERERGRIDRAIEAYRRFLAFDPPVDLRQRVRRQIRDLELQPALETLQRGRDYSARFHALRRVAVSPTPRCTEVLIASLRDENLRFARVVWRTLREITGEAIGFEPEAWERWWAAQKAQVTVAAGGEARL